MIQRTFAAYCATTNGKTCVLHLFSLEIEQMYSGNLMDGIRCCDMRRDRLLGRFAEVRELGIWSANESANEDKYSGEAINRLCENDHVTDLVQC